MTALATQTLQWMAVSLALLAAFAGVAVLTARSLFAACVALAALCACAGAAVLALGYGEAALMTALVGAGLAPALLLGAVLLSAPTVQPRSRRWPWLSVVGASAVVLVVLFAAAGLQSGAPIAAPKQGGLAAIALIVFAAAAATVGLLAYGERGLLHSSDADSSQ